VTEVEERQGFVSENNGYAEFGPNYLRLQGDTPWEAYEKTVDSLLGANDALPWWIGDALLFGENKWGEMYTQAIQEKYQREYDTLRNYVYVARAYQFGDRSPNLSWTHHLRMAVLPEEQRAELMAEAQPQEGDKRPRLSVRDVQERVRDLTSTEEERLFKVPGSRPEQDNHLAAQKYPLLRYENFGAILDWQLDSMLEKLDAMDEDERAEALMRIRPRPNRSPEDAEFLRWLAGFDPVEHDENGDAVITTGFDLCPHCKGTGRRKYYIDDEGQVIYEKVH
jgi:hypothetical protein